MPDQHLQPLLSRVGSLPTSGARAAEIFRIDGAIHLAMPQLAYDVAERAAHMNGGDSDTDMLVFRWDGVGFVEVDRLAVPGGEDAEFFTIDGVQYLATASARSGKSPYQPNIESTIFRRVGQRWEPSLRVPGFFAKQWRYFSIGDRHFLALALGVTIEGPVAVNPNKSCIFEWLGGELRLLQTLEGRWGYNWTAFEIDGRHFLAYADHVGASEILEWDGARFAPFQTLEGKTGRAFQFMNISGDIQLSYARIAADTVALRWSGARFEPFQTLSGPGGREFAAIERNGVQYLVQVNFIEGSPQQPKTDLVSFIHGWDGKAWQKLYSFETFGATDAAFFEDGDRAFLVVANSLTPQVRFRQDSAVYEFLG